MLRLRDPQLKLWDTLVAQPELLALPARLKEVDRYLDDDRFMEPFLRRAQRRVGRPTVPMERYLRLMYLKHERGLGYETLVQEVADSLTLRRFVRLDISEPVPHPTTLSRLTQRFGASTVAELHHLLVTKLAEAGIAKGRRLRTDTTVIEANVEYPTDAGLLYDGVRLMGRAVDRLRKAGRKLGRLGTNVGKGFRNSTRTMRKVMFDINRFLKKRVVAGHQYAQPDLEGSKKAETIDGKAEIKMEVDRLTAKAARVAKKAIAKARQVARRTPRQVARASKEARAHVKRLCSKLRRWSDLTQRALEQAHLRLAGQKSIPNRMVSLHDPDARPIRKGKLSQPVQFGALAEVTQVENQVVSDYRIHIGNPGDSTLLVGVIQRHKDVFGRVPDEAAADRGYYSTANEMKLGQLGVKYVSIPATGKVSRARSAHQAQPWFKRGQRFRAGSEGGISNLKRRYGLRRSMLRGHEGWSCWAGWGVFAHNLNIPARLKVKSLKSKGVTK